MFLYSANIVLRHTYTCTSEMMNTPRKSPLPGRRRRKVCCFTGLLTGLLITARNPFSLFMGPGVYLPCNQYTQRMDFKSVFLILRWKIKKFDDSSPFFQKLLKITKFRQFQIFSKFESFDWKKKPLLTTFWIAPTPKFASGISSYPTLSSHLKICMKLEFLI